MNLQLGLGLGACALGAWLAYSAYNGLSPERWTPAEGVLPGEGLEVKARMKVGADGEFRLRIETPFAAGTDGVGIPDLPDVKCHVMVEARNDAVYESQSARTFDHGGRIYSSSTELYYAEDFLLRLPAGTYELRVTGAGACPQFHARGASFTLVRDENYKDAAVFWQLTLVLGGGIGVVGLILVGIVLIRVLVRGERLPPPSDPPLSPPRG